MDLIGMERGMQSCLAAHFRVLQIRFYMREWAEVNAVREYLNTTENRHQCHESIATHSMEC